jgi:DNA-binding HxlR family transcriptional regulator
MAARSYAQHCGLARALDVLGERWTLLVIRELARGPKRFRDLLANLPGIGTNLLAARLRALEAEGVVRRALLPPPAGVRVYELTERGAALRGPLEGLALWGFDLLGGAPGDDATARATWAAMSMRAAAVPDELEGAAGTYAFEVGEERFHVTVSPAGAAELRDGVPAAEPDVRATLDLDTFFALASRALTARDAVAAGRATVAGDAGRLERLLAGFHLPVH